ncbi:MAG: hypothetical protein RLO81_09650, partial [Fulvivirga sp.]|uniref:hypothetical protein n=1 Tax=Fulvivirga sp. TaxID=1931237 RepID=UPI0032EEAEC2
MRLIVTICILFSYSIILAQTEINSIELDLKSGGSGFFFGIGAGDAEIIPLTYSKQTPTLCIRDNSNIYIIGMDSTFSPTSNDVIDMPSYSELLGGYLSKNIVTLIYSTDRKKSIYIQQFDTKSKEFKSSSFSLNKKEKFITFFQEGNKCYLLTSIKNSSTVTIYPFESHELDK